MLCYARPKENEVKVKLEMVLELGEMDVGELATAIRREVRAMDIPNPDGGVMFLEHLSVVVKEVAGSENLPEVPTCTKSQTPIDWGRVEQAEALGVAVHATPAIDDGCYHDWENGEDGNPERCSKCGLSFMRFIHSCCP